MKKNQLKLLNEIVADHKRRIDKLGISQREFCRIAGIHENTLYTLSNPRISTLQRIEVTLLELEGK